MDSDSTLPVSRHLRLDSKSSECERLYGFIADSLENLPVTLEFKHDLKLVAEELLANIINHGYAGNAGQHIDLALEIDERSVRLTFTDAGAAFNPLERNSPETLNDLSEGGMGLLLVKSLTDRQHYAREGDLNVFTVTKNYNNFKT